MIGDRLELLSLSLKKRSNEFITSNNETETQIQRKNPWTVVCVNHANNLTSETSACNAETSMSYFVDILCF